MGHVSITLAQKTGDTFVREFHNSTTVHPLGLFLVLLSGALICLLPRRWALVPCLLTVCFVSMAQRVVVGGLDFNFIRLLALFAMVRIVMRGEYKGLRLVLLDYVLIAHSIVRAVATFILYQGDVSKLVFMLGRGYDSLGLYFMFRALVRSPADLARLATAFAAVAIPVSISFIIEKVTGRNSFSIFGGVNEITKVREGKVRATGAFSHPIIAGTFWASVLPLMGSLWLYAPKLRWLVVSGVVAVGVIVIACASSTPVAAVGLAGIGGAFFFVRRWMRMISWSIFGLLLVLHFAMEAPVWHLISRIDLVGGSTGWHRYHLIDAAIRHFDEWAYVGTTSTGHWGRQLFDVTNQYVVEAISGGLLGLILWIGVIWFGFREVGMASRRVRSLSQSLLVWSVGVMLFVHAMAFLAVTYFGQAQFVLAMTLASAVSMRESMQRKAMTAPAPPAASPGVEAPVVSGGHAS